MFTTKPHATEHCRALAVEQADVTVAVPCSSLAGTVLSVEIFWLLM
jgi:hypothetical protein